MRNAPANHPLDPDPTRRRLLRGILGSAAALSSIGPIATAAAAPTIPIAPLPPIDESSYAPETVWVHGNVAQPEYPQRLVINSETSNGILHRGWGTVFQGAGVNFFHFPISATIATSGNAPLVKQVYVLFQCAEADAFITTVDLWDGPTRLHSFSNLHRFGDHYRAPDALNAFTLPRDMEVQTGIGVSVGVTFSTCVDSAGCVPAVIMFAAVGVGLLRRII